MIDRRLLAAVFAGGFAGALLRTGLSEAFPVEPGAWPWATFGANVAGAFLLGLVATRMPRRLPLLGAGFCGALTTFSTVQIELLRMLDDGRTGLAIAYAATSVLAGLVAVALATRGRGPAARGAPA